jgi:iron complex transport system ATP-binding protein
MDKQLKNDILTTKALSIGYCSKDGINQIYSDINISLKSKKLVCLLGKNGAGKSTLLRTISKTQHALSGEVIIQNKNLKDTDHSDLAKTMSLVLTEKIPESQLTVYELIALGRQPYTNWLGKLTTEDSKIIDTAIELAGVKEIAHKKNYELSDGQLQKVMIARALSQDTSIIILDEPTAHLDLHHKIEVFKLLQNLVKKTKKTIIFSTHEVNLALNIADELWLMLPDKFTSGSIDFHIKENNLENLFSTNQVEFNAELKQFTIKNQTS